MIDPDCKVCLGIGWVCENHPQQAWSQKFGCECGAVCPVNVFALTALKRSLTLATYSIKDRQHNTSVSRSSQSCDDCTASGW